MVITDGVFSMDGDIAKLLKCVLRNGMARSHGSDAHASGVWKERRGTVDHYDLPSVDIQVGTLSSPWRLGGYVAGPQKLSTT